jgi:hypothetical protein
LPRGAVTIRLKAFNRSGFASATDATVAIMNWPAVVNRDEYADDQKRKRPGGDSVARWGPAYSISGITKLYDDDGVMVGMSYDDGLGTTVNILQPVEGAAQKNRQTAIVQMADGDSYPPIGETLPAGYSIYSARYLSGGLSVQGASVWGTDPESLPGASAPPTTYAPTASFDIDGASMTAALLLKERLGVTYQPRSATFVNNVLTLSNQATTTVDIPDTFLPAHNGIYSCSVDGILTSSKTGTFSITLTLQTRRLSSSSYTVRDEKTFVGTLPGGGYDISFQLSGYVGTGWPSAGMDNAKVVIENITAPGNLNLSLTVGPLTWTQEDTLGSPKYASMSPNGEPCNVEVELEVT